MEVKTKKKNVICRKKARKNHISDSSLENTLPDDYVMDSFDKMFCDDKQ